MQAINSHSSVRNDSIVFFSGKGGKIPLVGRGTEIRAREAGTENWMPTFRSRGKLETRSARKQNMKKNKQKTW